MISPKELSLAAQTAFASVTELTLVQDQLRSVADLPGGFVSKSVKGHEYWYYQYSEPSGARRQVFVGLDSPSLRQIMSQSTPPSDSIESYIRAAVVHGCAAIPAKHFKVIRRLADYGFFRAGGILVGTHAFLAYGNILGVKWSQLDVAQTQDIDFAHPGRNISLALAADQHVDIPSAVQSLEMGFLPIATMAGGTGGAYLNPKDKEFRLDFLTTCTRDGESPYLHPALGITLQPLKYMEYSLEGVQQTPLLNTSAAVMINLPRPERFALHKLIVASLREGAFSIKRGKDLLQACLLLQVMRETHRWSVEEAWADLQERGPAWRKHANQGLELLNNRFPEYQFTDWLST